MKLKDFEKVNAATRTRYTVYDDNEEYVESFDNYILDEKGNAIHDDDATFFAYSQLRKYQNATVKHVSFSKVFKALTVTIYTKGGES